MQNRASYPFYSVQTQIFLSFATVSLFGRAENKDILIAFLNDVLDHQHVGKLTEVEFLPTVQDPDIASQKESILDVLCKDQSGAQYIVEMQLARTENFIKRAQHYAAKAYSRQLLEGEQYGRLKEVIFLAITDFVLFADKPAVKSDHLILDKASQTHDLRGLYFTFIELPKFSKKIEEVSGPTECWYYYLKHAPETIKESYEKLVRDAPIMERAYGELDKYNWSEAELNTYEQNVKRLRDNRSVLLYQREEGRKEGAAKRSLEIAKSLLQQGVALSTIASATGLSVGELEELKAKMGSSMPEA